MRTVWILVAVGLMLPPAAYGQEVEESAAPTSGLLPQIDVLGQVGVGAVLGGEPSPAGRRDFSESGFQFERLEVALHGVYGQHVRVHGRVVLDEHAVDLDHASIGVVGLPWHLDVRAGLLRTRVGRYNERDSEDQTFVAHPLVMGKMFGPVGHRTVGMDLHFSPPAPWDMAFFAAMTSANGAGQRSFYGEGPVEVEHPRDFSYQLGMENDWDVAGLRLGFDVHAVLGPNNTGRANGTDLYGASFVLDYDDGEGTGVGLEAEWYLRRRQIIAGVLQDLGGFAALTVGIAQDYGLAARYELTAAASGDYLDPLDEGKRHRATFQASWKPVPFLRMRLAGSADFGGPLDDSVYTVLLHLEAGATTCQTGVEGGRCTRND